MKKLLLVALLVSASFGFDKCEFYFEKYQKSFSKMGLLLKHTKNKNEICFNFDKIKRYAIESATHCDGKRKEVAEKILGSEFDNEMSNACK